MNDTNVSNSIIGNHTGDAADLRISIDAHAWLQLLLIWIIVSVSTATNCMVLIILIKKPKLRTVSNLLVFNLTIADLLLCTVTAPFVTAAIVVNDWRFGHALCQLLAFSVHWCLCALLWTLFLISLNRFYMIVHAQTYAAKFTKQRAKISLFLLWLISMATAIPPLIGWGEYSFDRGKSMCFLNSQVGVSYVLFYVTVSTFIPLISMVYCYWNIFLVVRQNSMRIKNTAKALIQTSALVIAEGTGSPHYSRHGEGQGKHDFLPGVVDAGENPRLGIPTAADFARRFSAVSIASRATLLQPPQERQEQAKLTRMLGLVFAVYIVIWMPVATILVVEATAKVTFHEFCDRLSIICVYLQACCNPLVYGLINETYRNVFCEVLCCRKVTSPKSRRHISVVGGDHQSSTVLSMEFEHRAMVFNYSKTRGSLPSVSDKSVAGDKASNSGAGTGQSDAGPVGSLLEVKPLALDVSPEPARERGPSRAADMPRNQQIRSSVTLAWQASMENGLDDLSVASLNDKLKRNGNHGNYMKNDKLDPVATTANVSKDVRNTGFIM